MDEVEKNVYGKSFVAKFGTGTCKDCNKPIQAGQLIRYKYVNGCKYITHADCSSVPDQHPSKYGKAFICDYDKGYCYKCGESIRKGQMAYYLYDNGKKLCHYDCENAAKQEEEYKKAAPYTLFGGSGYGCQGWMPNQVVHTPAHKIKEGYPEYLFVIRAGHKYYSEDGLSFGVGDDSGYTYWAHCRAATEEEARPLREQEEQRAIIEQSLTELKELAEEVMRLGEKPDGHNTPVGDRWFDTGDVYGSGSWWVVGPEWIWYVKNNGMDGDNWSLNNVITGGAGAIGWRIKREAIINRLSKIKSTLSLRCGHASQC